MPVTWSHCLRGVGESRRDTTKEPRMNAFDFSEQTVLVTGAATGIGLGIARAFHGAGARVAMGDLREGPLGRAASGLGGGGRVLALPADVRDPASVANAAIYPSTPVVDMGVDDWDRVMDPNVKGVFIPCKAAARSMMVNGTP